MPAWTTCRRVWCPTGWPTNIPPEPVAASPPWWTPKEAKVSPVEERDRIIAMAEGREPGTRPVVEVSSFGFKYGAPGGDLVLDVRFIPNPYYIAELRPLTGRDPACADYVLGQPQSPHRLHRRQAPLGRHGGSPRHGPHGAWHPGTHPAPGNAGRPIH